MRILKHLGVCLLAVGVAACGSSKKDPKTPGAGGDKPAPPSAVATPEAQAGYKAALDLFAGHDQKNDWNEAACSETAKAFLDANEKNKSTGKELPEAVYNAGLAQQRCHNDAEAKKHFQKALDLEPKFHRSKAQLALYSYKEGGDAALEATIQSLQQAVLDAEFQNTEALVNLAMLQMKRGSSASGTGCQNDLDCAKKNIQRALAVDDSYMPAFNQLALYYLERAKEKVGRAKNTKVVTSSKKKEKKIDQQQLELAALVCSQAIRKNPKYAAIHNTAGLIQVELGNINSAVSAFETASRLDPNFFEALMNYAAVNLSFRGFKNADDAYRNALKQRPNDYDAHLGLALAIRGQINDSNLDKLVAEVQSELDKAKQIAPERPEAYFNEGILTQEYKVKAVTDPKGQVPVYKASQEIYKTFITKAGGGAEFADAVKRAKERIEDSTATIQFIEQGIKAAEEMPPPTDTPGGLEGSPEGEGEKKPEGGEKKEEAPKQ